MIRAKFDKPGIGGETFKIKLSNEWFKNFNIMDQVCTNHLVYKSRPVKYFLPTKRKRYRNRLYKLFAKSNI